MLRVVASTLLLVILASLGLPAATTTNLPACCRAGGAHHCMAMRLLSSAGDHFITQRDGCPNVHPDVLPHFARPQGREIPTSEETHPFLQEFVPGFLAAHSDLSRSDRAPPTPSR